MIIERYKNNCLPQLEKVAYYVDDTITILCEKF